MTNPFSYNNTSKPTNLMNNSNPFNLSNINSQSGNVPFQSSHSNLITSYFGSNMGNQSSSNNITNNPFSVIPKTSSTLVPSSGFNNPQSQIPNSSINPFVKANEYKPNNISVTDNGLNSKNPFLIQGNTTGNNNIANGGISNPFSIPNNQSNAFQSANNYLTNNNNPNVFNQTNFTSVPGSNLGNSTNQQQSNPFNLSNTTNQSGTANQFNTINSNLSSINNLNKANPFGNTNNSAYSAISNINTINTTNSNNTTNPFNAMTNRNNPFSTVQTTIVNNTNNQNNNGINTNPFSTTGSSVGNTNININNNLSNLNYQGNNSQPNGFNPNITNSAISFGPPKTDNSNNSFNVSFCANNNNNNNTNAFPQSQQNQTPQFNQSSNNTSNPFNIQPPTNSSTFNSPFYSNYSLNNAIPFAQPQNSFQYPQYAQLPYDLQYSPLFINQNINYNTINQSIEEIESKYLSQYLDTSIINKDKEDKENKKNAPKDINSLLLNHYEENNGASYYLPSINKENEFDSEMTDLPKLPKIKPKRKKYPNIVTQHKIVFKSNSRMSTVQPFRNIYSNSQSTIKKQSFTFSNAFSQSSISSSSSCLNGSCDTNYEFEVTVLFETPIKLMKVIKTKRFINKDKLVRDLVERFKERKIDINPKDFILLLNGKVISNDNKQIDLSKEAFSFSETDNSIKKVTIPGYFYQNKTGNDIIEENPQTEQNDEDSFGPMKDDFYPKTKSFITLPPIDELISMSKSQLEKVNNFTIENNNGKISFNNSCDLTYVNLDGIEIGKYLIINIIKHNMFIDKLRMKCTVEFYNILLDDTSFYQMNELKSLCETNLKSDQYHYEKEVEKLIVEVDLSKL